MTIIVWDGKTLAADKQATNNGHAYKFTKIFRVGDDLIGFCGSADLIPVYLNWFRNGCTAADWPKTQTEQYSLSALVVKKDKTLLQYEQQPYPMDMSENSVLAMGSGRDYALGAMAMGADACRAVEIACQCDVDCGMGIDTLTLEDN